MGSAGRSRCGKGQAKIPANLPVPAVQQFSQSGRLRFCEGVSCFLALYTHFLFSVFVVVVWVFFEQSHVHWVREKVTEKRVQQGTCSSAALCMHDPGRIEA